MVAWRVPFVDFPEQFRQQEKEVMGTVHDVLAGGDLIMRRHLSDFESHLADFVGTAHAIGVSNCTDALRLLCHAYGFGPGDEVVTVAHTFVATISPFKLAGATPVLVDVGEDHNMDPTSLALAVSERTRAIVPVHLNGRTCEMDSILTTAQSVGAVVIEDAAQALGASYKGKSAGTFGAAAVYSFYPAKLLGALGDAGAVVTDDASLAHELRMLRDHGRVDKTTLGGWGYNCRLDNLQAAILDQRLSCLPGWIERRREIAFRYDSVLRDLPTVKTLPPPSNGSERFDVFQNYPILTPRRDELVARLTMVGIETLISWPIPLHYQGGLSLGDFNLPFTEEISRSVVSLPLFPELRDDDVDFVADQVRRFLS